MRHPAARLPFTIRPFAVAAVTLVVALAHAVALPEAQAPARKALTIDDYARWRSIGSQTLSADGTWVAYVLRQMNTIAAESKPVLHVRNLETGTEVTVDDATDPEFSADSKWIAYQVDPGAAARARGTAWIERWVGWVRRRAGKRRRGIRPGPGGRTRWRGDSPAAR